MEQSRFDRIETIEVELDSATQLKYKIGDRDNLRGAKVNAIMALRVGECAEAPVGARPLVTDALFEKSFLTLSINGEESIDTVPLTVFNPSDNDGRLFVFSVPKVINWESSSIVLSSPSADATKSYLLVVFYERAK